MADSVTKQGLEAIKIQGKSAVSTDLNTRTASESAESGTEVGGSFVPAASRRQAEKIVKVNAKPQTYVQVLHVDIIGDEFWNSRPDILSE